MTGFSGLEKLKLGKLVHPKQPKTLGRVKPKTLIGRMKLRMPEKKSKKSSNNWKVNTDKLNEYIE